MAELLDIMLQRLDITPKKCLSQYITVLPQLTQIFTSLTQKPLLTKYCLYVTSRRQDVTHKSRIINFFWLQQRKLETFTHREGSFLRQTIVHTHIWSLKKLTCWVKSFLIQYYKLHKARIPDNSSGDNSSGLVAVLIEPGATGL